MHRTQEHCMRNMYAGSILVTDFIAAEKTHGESGVSIFVCIKVMNNSIAATVNIQDQWEDILLTWDLEPESWSAWDCIGVCLFAVWFKQEPILSDCQARYAWEVFKKWYVLVWSVLYCCLILTKIWVKITELSDATQ